MIFLKCHICRIQLQKKKSGVKKCLEISAIKGGGRRLMAKSILNFHFDYPHTSLSFSMVIAWFCCLIPLFYHFSFPSTFTDANTNTMSSKCDFATEILCLSFTLGAGLYLDYFDGIFTDLFKISRAKL